MCGIRWGDYALWTQGAGSLWAEHSIVLEL